jgi:DNA-binding NarL/FixJ family response regulator
MRTKVLLAEDHQIVRSGLRRLLENEPGFEVVAEANDGRNAVALASELSPDVVVMDVAMPGLDGVEATRQILDRSGGATRVVALSGHSDPRFVSRMLAAGASAYVLKASAFAELALALRSVAAGGTYASPSVSARSVVADDVDGGRAASACGKLSPRQREVLRLLAEGKAMKQAATHLRVSVKTIETHRRKLMDKLGLHTVAELTKYAIREGLTTADT